MEILTPSQYYYYPKKNLFFFQNNIPATNQEFVQKLFIVHWPPMKGVFFFQGESVHNWHQYISIIVHNG